MEWMILPLRRYAQFSGRSQRKEYWMFALLNIIASIILSLLDTALGLGGHVNDYATQSAGGFAAGAYGRGGLLSSIWSLAILLPSLAVAVRRLHDIDRSGWWLLAPVLPILLGVILTFASAFLLGGLLMLAGGISAIVLLVWACMDGTRGPNRFGPDPKGTHVDLQETFR
jgi:uncharacterized membrane protein YhaH (DUF805 family)